MFKRISYIRSELGLITCCKIYIKSDIYIVTAVSAFGGRIIVVGLSYKYEY